MAELSIQFESRLLDIKSDEWNALNLSGNPFLKYQFLAALEASGSVSSATGWQPSHLTVRNKQQQLIAAMPSYIKQHSYGEYVFDWSWADAYSHYGLNYYPKLLTAIPFTPSVGPRLLVNPQVQQEAIAKALIQAVNTHAEQYSLSSWHLLFPNSESLEAFRDPALMVRQGCQFQWSNARFESFEQFLEQMTSRKRKNIKKERRQVSQQDIQFVHFEGREITQQALDKFYLFYHATYLKRGQQGYLNQSFFQKICASMPDNLLLIMAEKGGEFVAGALFLKDDETLYGRYWGCLEEYKQLHFETCYYQGIDYCINHKLKRFDAGAQGEHKIQRGFEPIPTYSLHWIKNKDFRNPIKDFISREQQQVSHYIKDAYSYLPFKKEG
ncbi:GNAT family N-acetyltransferase [Alkalimarinus sediminis]|uniref:GNAT family N-acetyltransferase n=1 Tax=Alkalimarinus sediminis TaxID=1632866 RepID=A0A9E8HKU5_9ALTE|nr:GNAT family N-acetyltransferase [Alkalimarinus sediminis]UZW75192.1 GNAT family N-acetyltransferase [Alkalimarinus sediminis]